jgi:hypothetical protein
VARSRERGFARPARRRWVRTRSENRPVSFHMEKEARPKPAELSNEELIGAVERIARFERRATAALVAHLAELDRRELHVAAGFRSPHEYCHGPRRPLGRARGDVRGTGADRRDPSGRGAALARTVPGPVHRERGLPGQTDPRPGAPGPARRSRRSRGRVRSGVGPAPREAREAEVRGDEPAAVQEGRCEPGSTRLARRTCGGASGDRRPGRETVHVRRPGRTAVHGALGTRVRAPSGACARRAGHGREPLAPLSHPQRVRRPPPLRAPKRPAGRARSAAALRSRSGSAAGNSARNECGVRRGSPRARAGLRSRSRRDWSAGALRASPADG